MLNPVAFYPILWARSPPHLPILQDHKAVAFEAQFYFDGTPRDCKLFFTEGDWFRFENCWRSSKFDTRQYTQHQNGIFPSQRFPTCGRTCPRTHYTWDPPVTCPSGFAHHVPYPLDKALFTPGLTQGSAPRGSHLSLVIDKVKHDDIFNRPFVNILLCWKLWPYLLL